MSESHGIAIREVYKDYTPLICARESVDRLLNGIPRRLLAGLVSVVITDSSCLSHDRRKGTTKSRGRKIPTVRCRGFYHQKWRGEPAWIELLLDNILEPWPKWALRIPLLRDSVVSETLFHEIGHHIHKTQAPQHREQEDVAEMWKKKLTRHCFQKHYWYFIMLSRPIQTTLKPIYWFVRMCKK